MKRVVLSVTLSLGLALGCSSPPPPQLRGPIDVSTINHPARVTVSGLGADRRVAVTVTSTDARGIGWTARTTLRLGPTGHVTVDAAELIAAMTPIGSDRAGAYVWRGPTGAQQFRVSVAGGSVTVARRLSAQPVHRTPVTAGGLVGTFYRSAAAGGHGAVLMIGGSEGGQPGPLLPTVLAGMGYPVLALAYFKAAGLPPTLAGVPLEYFATALRWLSRQPGVDPAKLVVDGTSRGGEAALLIGATFPELVHGVIAGVPSDVAICSFPGCNGPAWTLHGKPVPYTRQFDNPYPTDNRHAAIHVQRINGPVLLDCAGQDQIWDSCGYAQAVMNRLRHDRFTHQLQRCEPCDHFVGSGVPGEPYSHQGTLAVSLADIAAYPAFFRASIHLLERLP